MNDDFLEILLHRILSGYLIFYYKQEKYELRKISNSLRYEADLLYHKILSDEKYNDWIRQENVDGILINLGLWHKDTNMIMEKLEKSIDNLKVELYENFINTSQQKKIRNSLNSTRNSLDKIRSIKAEFSANTLEGYAASIKNETIICNSLFKNNQRVFREDNKDSDSSSLSYFNELVTEINKYNISIAYFRKLARHYTWRSYWNIKNHSIFPGTISEWTDDQRSLSSFSQMYDSVYEHPECPDDKIIEDDDMLDGWMISQKRKIAKAKKQANIDNINPNLRNANEVFLFGQKPEEIEEILSLNSKESLHRMREKINYINQAGSAKDDELPDVRRQIMSDAQNIINNRK
jgi:hypothetical protein